jgi:uncharacterized protein HemY
MPELPQSSLDSKLDRLSKMGGILLPLVVAVVGGLYTLEKDRDDARTLQRQDKRDSQTVKYANLAALVPMLTSQDLSNRLLAIEIYTSELKKDEAPPDLKCSILRLCAEHPGWTAAKAALEAAVAQSKKRNPSASQQPCPDLSLTP